MWYQSNEHILQGDGAMIPGGTVKYSLFPTCVRHPSRDFSFSQCLEFLPGHPTGVANASSLLSWSGPTNTPLFTGRHRFNSSLGWLLIILNQTTYYARSTRLFTMNYQYFRPVFLSRKNNKASWVDDIGYPTSRPFLACLEVFYWSVLELVKHFHRFDWISVQYVFVASSTVHGKKFFRTALVWMNILFIFLRLLVVISTLCLLRV